MHVQTDADATIFTVTLQLIVGPTEVGRSVHVGLTSGHEGSPCLDRGAKGANAWGPQLSDAKTPQHAPQRWLRMECKQRYLALLTDPLVGLMQQHLPSDEDWQ